MSEPGSPRVKTALVTGASRGIGRGIALRLARRGYGLTICARRTDALLEVSAELKRAGAPGVVMVAADLADPGAAERTADAHAERYGSMDVLVLNAGVGTVAPVADSDPRRLRKTWTVNVEAPFLIIQRCLPLLRAAAARDAGAASRIIALASITGNYPEAGMAAYGASKAALISLMATLNREEAANRVLATAISPAYVDTDMTSWVHDSVPPGSMIPVGDIVEVADLIVRLSPNTLLGNVILGRRESSGYCA